MNFLTILRAVVGIEQQSGTIRHIERKPMGKERKTQSVRIRAARLLLPVFLFGTLVAALMVFIPNRVERSSIVESQKHTVGIQFYIVEDELIQIISDINFLAQLSCIPDLFSDDPWEKSRAMENIRWDFLMFSNARQIYDQVRLIDETGFERIRVNLIDGKAVIVPQEELQDKRDRYYFTESFKLEPGEAYISPLDLNIEHGELEVPYKAMIRIGMPVTDHLGKKRGIIVLNYLGEKLLKRMEQAAILGNLRLFFLNSDGYWFRGPTAEDEWGFMFDDRKERTIYERFPEAAAAIMNFEEGSIETRSGLFSFSTIRPHEKWQAPFSLLKVHFSEAWKCVSFISKTDLNRPIHQRLATIGMGWIIYLFVTWLIVWNWVTADEMRKRSERELRRAKNEAESANRTKTIFLANMSHEIRTPMNAILGFTEILEAEERDPRRRKYIEAINSSGTTLLAIINDLLDLSKVEADKIVLKPEPTDITSLMEELRYIYAPLAEKKHLILDVEIATATPEALLIDRTRLRQILVNLVGNAIKFTTVGGVRIVINTWKQSEESTSVDLRIDVADSGPGIAVSDQERIFGIFEQGEVAWDRKYGGTGLGLAISRRLSTLMGGTISLTSSPGEGAIFSIELPNVAIVEKASLEKENEDTENVQFSPSKLLLVDDVPENNLLIRGFLSDCPFTYREASNGAEALSQLSDFTPDLIISDLKMPIMGGIQLIEKIKADEGTASIPIILLTASITKNDEWAMKIYADSFLRKPIRKSRLIEEVKRYLPYEEGSSSDTPSDDEDEKTTPQGEREASREELKNLIATMERSFLPRLHSIGQDLLVDDIIDIADEIGTLAQSYHVPDLVKWGTSLRQSMLSFDIDAVRQQLASFDEFLAVMKQKVASDE